MLSYLHSFPQASITDSRKNFCFTEKSVYGNSHGCARMYLLLNDCAHMRVRTHAQKHTQLNLCIPSNGQDKIFQTLNLYPAFMPSSLWHITPFSRQ